MHPSRRDTCRILFGLMSNERDRTSSWLLVGLIAVIVLVPGSSGPRITASVGFTNSNYNNWYAQNRTPVYPNNTKTLSVVNIEGSYANGSPRRSLLLQAQQVTNASGGNSTTLFQQEFPGYAAGD